ncbi:hypothetical protein [Paraburkholderia kururiensis]|uniref:hypothetical protein n=1 Tax=Paraburkholderia kururiensis TaxID=984307 RepID=UPI000F871BA9|nr:hypothetical protein [Paraburkholderia kururiensis]
MTTRAVRHVTAIPPGPASRFHFPLPAGQPPPPRRCEWPFYLDRQQRARLRWLHQAWGDDAVIQIYSGCVRIRGECGDWRFSDETQLRVETARRHGHAVLRQRPHPGPDRQ